MTQKTVLLGIDGADWTFLDGWLESGAMPNLARLVRGGVRAPLQSVTPLNSAAAWVTIMTGRSPGGHGVFGFMVNSGSRKSRPVRSDDIAAAALWDITGEVNEPVGIINCPITYPPPKLDGFVVSGILIPYNDLWAYPLELEAELRGLFGPYLVDVPWVLVDERKPGARERFIAELYLMTRKQEEVALRCMTTRPWRILGVFFTGTDRIMHRFWHYTDPNHPLYDAEAAGVFGNEIRKYFTLVDGVIGNLLDKAGDARVMVVSDHGFGPLYYRFHLRRWLAENGYLVETEADDSRDEDEALRGIDLSASRAFPAGLSESGVWLNLKGRQPQGTVTPGEYDNLRGKIMRGLESFMDESGQKPLKRASRREDILVGPFVDEAPDILLEPNDEFIVDDSVSDAVITLSERETGTHRPEGIFVASGAGLQSGASLRKLRSVDVLPTLLAAAGLPVPEGIEGEVVREIFDKPPDVAYLPPISTERTKRRAGSPQEDEKRKKLLKGLGYL